MHNNLLDILSRKVQPISNEQLADYLTGKLTNAENQEMEASLLESDAYAEAMEGLLLLENKEKLQQYQLEIQKGLRDKLQQKTTKRLRKKQIPMSQVLILTGALLAFILLLWVMLHLLYSE